MAEDDYKNLQQYLAILTNRLAKLVASEGTLVIMCPNKTRPDSHSGRNSLIWLPIYFDVIARKSRVSEVPEDNWSRYFSTLGVQGIVFNVTPDAPYTGWCGKGTWGDALPKFQIVDALVQPIAVNRVGELMGARVDLNFESGGTVVTQGSICIVPVPLDGDEEGAIRCWLEDTFDSVFSTPPPAWADGIAIPGLEGIEARLGEVQKTIEGLESTRDKFLKEKETKIHWRGLVYETGGALQTLCEKAFQELGAETRPSDVSDEFIVIVDQNEMLVEVKGVGKSVSKGHLGQVVVDSDQRGEENRFDRVALVVNAWKDLPLIERDTNDHPRVPVNIDEMARPAGVVLIRTDVLLEALRRHWCNNDGLDTLRSMMLGTGIFALD